VTLGCVFAALAFSLLGFYELNPPPILMKLAGGSQAGYLGSFFMGTTVGVVAAPCVGPVLIALLTYVGKLQNSFLGFLYFFALSAGLGTPYLFLGIFSGQIQALPRAGAWMVAIRKIFGLALLGLAYHTVCPLLPGVTVRKMGWAFLGFIFSGYLLRDSLAHPAPIFRRVGTSGAAILLVFCLGMALPEGQGTLVIDYGLPLGQGYFRIRGEGHGAFKSPEWASFSEVSFQGALSTGKPIILDFRADWCAACRELESQTFVDPRVARELEKFVLLKIDLTGSDIPGDQERAKDRYQVRGLPTILFFTASGAELDALRLTGFLPPEGFLAHLNAVHQAPPGKK
jgi:thiol:disulfide interchange protein DsbD